MGIDKKKLQTKNKLVHGVGINDADYPVQPTIGNKRVNCPFYWRWKDMLKRCYSEKHLLITPCYRDRSVNKEWFIFSIFKAWMEQQDWEGKQE